jgi:hypothetical protein
VYVLNPHRIDRDSEKCLGRADSKSKVATANLQSQRAKNDLDSSIRTLTCPLSRLLFVLNQGFEISERLVGFRPLWLIPHRCIPACLLIQRSRVLAVVAVHAQELPVAAVGGIMIVVAVFMMHRQLVKFFTGKFSSAPGAYPGQDFERLVAVNISPPFPKLPRFGNDVLQRVVIWSSLL